MNITNHNKSLIENNRSKYLKEAINLFYTTAKFDPREQAMFWGCSEAEIEYLETHYNNQKLPQAYREFLSFGGNGIPGGYFADCFYYEEFLWLYKNDKQSLRKYFEDWNVGEEFRDNIVPVYLHQGYEMLFFYLSEDQDQMLYKIDSTEGKIMKKDYRFSELFFDYIKLYVSTSETIPLELEDKLYKLKIYLLNIIDYLESVKEKASNSEAFLKLSSHYKTGVLKIYLYYNRMLTFAGTHIMTYATTLPEWVTALGLPNEDLEEALKRREEIEDYFDLIIKDLSGFKKPYGQV